MGFHEKEIEKGVYGELSKIREELEEAYDAEKQGQDLMLLIELSDMIGAIEGVAKKYGMTIEQLHNFSVLRSKVAIEELEEQQIEKIDPFVELISECWAQRGKLKPSTIDKFELQNGFNWVDLFHFLNRAVEKSNSYISFETFAIKRVKKMITYRG